jgi:hypothetical protein
MFKTPNTKTVTSAAVKIGAGVAGAKLSDGVVAILPESLGKAKKPIFAVVALAVAASVNASTTAGEAVQSAFIGMAIKQGADALTEVIKPSIAAKTTGTTSARFINAVVGHDQPAVQSAEMAERLSGYFNQLNSPFNEEVVKISTPAYAGL